MAIFIRKNRVQRYYTIDIKGRIAHPKRLNIILIRDYPVVAMILYFCRKNQKGPPDGGREQPQTYQIVDKFKKADIKRTDFPRDETMQIRPMKTFM